MTIYVVTKATIAAITSGANFYTASKSNWLFPIDKAFTGTGSGVLHYSDQQAEGQTIQSGSGVGGNSFAVVQVAPSYFPVATIRAECGAIVTDLAWADLNLVKGYEFAKLNATGTYFVSGILNSSQTLANDPFNSTTYPTLVSAACWNSSFQSSNPF